MTTGWEKILGKVFKEKKDEFVIEQVYQGLPENEPLFREFCYVPHETFQVYIQQSALLDVHQHALNGLRNGKEVAGVLVGRHLLDKKRNVEFIEILDVVQAQSGNSTSVDVNIPASEWGRIQVLVEDSASNRIVGWYHSHPRMRAFMSAVDQSTQLDHFNHNGQVAIVVGVGNDISEVKCFDHFSNEVNLYFTPQENDNQLIKANLDFSQHPDTFFFSRKSTKPIKYDISALDNIFDRVFRNYDVDRNFNLLGFDNPKGHIQGYDRLYPELGLGIEYYMEFNDDTGVLGAFENDFMFFAINVNELDLSKVINIIQTIYSSIHKYTKEYDAFRLELYREVFDEFELVLNQLRKQKLH